MVKLRIGETTFDPCRWQGDQRSSLLLVHGYGEQARGRVSGPPSEDRHHSGPLFLLGAARSGTSLLYKALCLHPDAAWISNWVRNYPALPQLAVLNRLARRMKAAQRQVWFGGKTSNAYVYLSRRSWFERAFPMPVEGEPVFTRYGITRETTVGTDPDRLEGLRSVFASIQRAGGGHCLVCKRIANNRRVPLLVAAFPQARFVEIVRDGRAVAYSLSRVDWWEDSFLSWYGGTPRDWVAKGGDPWELCARNWVEELHEIEAGLQAVEPVNVLRISYEGFVSSPFATLQEVAAFAGLPPDEDWVRRLRELRFPDRNEGWLQALEPAVVHRLEEVQRHELARYGYA